MTPDFPFRFLSVDDFWQGRMPLYIKPEIRGHHQHPIESQHHIQYALLDPWIITTVHDDKDPGHVLCRHGN